MKKFAPIALILVSALLMTACTRDEPNRGRDTVVVVGAAVGGAVAGAESASPN